MPRDLAELPGIGTRMAEDQRTVGVPYIFRGAVYVAWTSAPKSKLEAWWKWKELKWGRAAGVAGLTW